MPINFSRTDTAGSNTSTAPNAAPLLTIRCGFGHATQYVCSIRVPEAELEKLRTALRDGKERWHEVEAADGAVLVDLGQVVYLRVDSDEHRVGF